MNRYYSTPLVKPLLLTLLLLSTASYALPEQFEATYTLSTKGMALGETHYKLEKTSTQDQPRFRFTTHTQPTGLAALLVDKVIDESSEWYWHDNTLLPQQYHYRRSGKKRREKMRLFDWEQQQVTLREDGVEKVLEGLQPGTVDEAMFLLALMHDLASKKEQLRYPLAKSDRWAHYQFNRGDHTPIEVAAGHFETQLITRESNGKRGFRLWVAPNLHYLPVQVEYTERDGEKFQLQLKQTTLQN